MKNALLIFSLLFLLALTAGCAPDQLPAADGQLRAWIDAPLDGSVLPLKAYQIVAHASDPGQISRLEIEVNGVELAALDNSAPEQLLALFRQDWLPAAPGEYQIRVRAQNASGQWSESVAVKVTVEDQPQQTASPEPVESDTPEPTLCPATVTARENTTCRRGPTSYHQPLGYLLAGESAPLGGRNQDGTWWSVQLPGLDGPCWIADSTVEAACLPSDLAYLESPPFITRIGKSSSEFYWGDNPNYLITIQAQAGGESPLESLRLIYHVQNRDNWNSTWMVNTSGDIWEGTMNARSLIGSQRYDSAIVEYYLEAVSQNGLSTQSQMLVDIKLKKMP